MDGAPSSKLDFVRRLLALCEEQIHHDPESPAAKDACARIDAALEALVSGNDMDTYRWAAVVAQLDDLSKTGDAAAAAAAMVEEAPTLAEHRHLVLAALDAWRAGSGKWEATLALLDAAGLYKNPRRKRDLAEKPSELLRQRWAQVRRKGTPLAFRPLVAGE